MKKFRLATLGCRTNQYETQGFRKQLIELGLYEASPNEAADLCIVNTCTVTQSADQRSHSTIMHLLKDNPGCVLAVTGCLVQHQKEAIEKIPGVTHVIDNLKKETLIQALFPDLESWPEFSIEEFGSHTRAFVKVQDGCNSFCSYCVIPFVRGRSRSRSVFSVIEEVKTLIQSGYKEIVLTGINIGDFDGEDADGQKTTLADLVRAVDQVEGLKRLRLSSIDPDEVDDNLLDAIINGQTTCPSMHLVLQSGSNYILKRMNRKYTKSDIFSACERLRNANPDFTFTTDIIVGFPGETESDFQETMDVVSEICFAKVHMFPYSRRPMTGAARLRSQVPSEVIKERKQRLLRHAENVSFNTREAMLGKVMHVLIESEDDHIEGAMKGHTENFLIASVYGKDLQKGDIVKVELTKNTPLGLIGYPVGSAVCT